MTHDRREGQRAIVGDDLHHAITNIKTYSDDPCGQVVEILLLLLRLLSHCSSVSPNQKRKRQSADWLPGGRNATQTSRRKLVLRRSSQTAQFLGDLLLNQNMSVFLEPKARMIFENSPIRVIFSQRQGMNVFREDAAFQHLNQQHRDIIAALPRFHFVLDIQDEGLWYARSVATPGELARFSTT